MDADFEARFDKALLDAKAAMERLIAHGVAAENAACAALCRGAGCCCNDLADLDEFRYGGAAGVHFRGRFTKQPRQEFDDVEIHDPRCPNALASKIEERRATRPV